MPRLAALTRRWRSLPPAAVQLARIARFVGAVPADGGAPADVREQARRAGVPLVEGALPPDPHIGFLDDSIGLGQGLN